MRVRCHCRKVAPTPAARTIEYFHTGAAPQFRVVATKLDRVKEAAKVKETTSAK
jgi:hypothetical protein